MDSAPTIEIPLPSEHPGREDPSPASRDPLNALICALLDPYLRIEEIAENRKITVMRLGEILSAEPAFSTIDALRNVFALRAELLALHARASAVGTLTRIANFGKDDEVARRAATTLLRMFRPDGTPAPLPPEREPRPTESRSTEARPSGSGPYPTPLSRDDLTSSPSSVIDGKVPSDPAMRARRRGAVPAERDSADCLSEQSGSSPTTSAIYPHADTPAMRMSHRCSLASREVAELAHPRVPHSMIPRAPPRLSPTGTRRAPKR